MKQRKTGVPYKSTKEGVEEHYFHIRVPVEVDGEVVSHKSVGTVFMRREHPDAPMFASVARVSKGDNFSRSQGRSIARRKWFDGIEAEDIESEARIAAVLTPTFEEAERIFHDRSVK